MKISVWFRLTSFTGARTRLLAHKHALFSFLRQRWQALFGVCFEVLLYDLISTYFECDPPESGKRKFGYSRDKRPDCVQLVIALIVTPEGFPLAYEVMPGNTSDKTILADFLKQIEAPLTGKRIAPGSWIGGFPLRRHSVKCARATRLFTIWWAPRGDS